jgi:hypothetical protein
MAGSYLEIILESAIKKGEVNMVSEILSYGISPNMLFPSGQRPIHLAIVFDSRRVGALLAAHPSIDLDAPDVNGTTPVFLAKSVSSNFFLTLLWNHGALVEESGHVASVRREKPKKIYDKENTSDIVIQNVKHAVPDIQNEPEEEKILRSTCNLLHLPVLGENDIDDARGVRRRKSKKIK